MPGPAAGSCRGRCREIVYTGPSGVSAAVRRGLAVGGTGLSEGVINPSRRRCWARGGCAGCGHVHCSGPGGIWGGGSGQHGWVFAARPSRVPERRAGWRCPRAPAAALWRLMARRHQTGKHGEFGMSVSLPAVIHSKRDRVRWGGHGACKTRASAVSYAARRFLESRAPGL